MAPSEKLPADVFTEMDVAHLVQGTPDRRYGRVKRALASGDLIRLRRGLSFEIPVGNFSYTRIPQFNFTGVERVAEGNSIYLLASPTKALADFIVASKVELPPAALMNFLRIEEESLSQISWPLLKEIAENYRSIRLRKFVKALRKNGVPG